MKGQEQAPLDHRSTFKQPEELSVSALLSALLYGFGGLLVLGILSVLMTIYPLLIGWMWPTALLAVTILSFVFGLFLGRSNKLPPASFYAFVKRQTLYLLLWPGLALVLGGALGGRSGATFSLIIALPMLCWLPAHWLFQWLGWRVYR